ncbi:MAG: hypothetical protein MUE96_09730 [Bacteroidia bacterium]|jgi:hypothetical protein|nr:hypothetical protein [Bacteroidia bacterium]
MRVISICIILRFVLLIEISAFGQQPSTSLPKNPRVGTVKTTAADSLKLKPDTLYNDSIRLNRTSRAGLVSAGVVIMVPQKEFADRINQLPGFGFDIQVMANLAKARTIADWNKRWFNVYVGGYFQFIHQDGTSDVYNTKDLYYETEIASKVRNRMYAFGGASRLEFFPKPFRVFVEGGAGLRIFNASHSIEITQTPLGTTGVEPETDRTAKTLKGNFLTNYAYGTGVRIGYTLTLELKLSWVNGGQAQYIDIESVTFDRTNNSIQYNTKSSRTDMFNIHIGIASHF